MARRTIKGHEEESIVALFLDGYLPHEIATDFSRSRRAVESALRFRGYNPKRFSYDESKIDEWVAYYTGDMDGTPRSVNWIARTYGRSWGTVAVRVAERVGRLRHPSKRVKKQGE